MASQSAHGPGVGGGGARKCDLWVLGLHDSFVYSFVHFGGSWMRESEAINYGLLPQSLF